LFAQHFEEFNIGNKNKNKNKNITQISQRTFNKLNLDFSQAAEQERKESIEKKDIVELT